jgi:hypothetical protein
MPDRASNAGAVFAWLSDWLKASFCFFFGEEKRRYPVCVFYIRIMKKKIIFVFVCMALAFLLGCKKEKIIAIPEHVGGSLYVKKRVTESEYIEILKERERMEKEKDRAERESIKRQERKRQEVIEWGKNFDQMMEQKREQKLNYSQNNFEEIKHSHEGHALKNYYREFEKPKMEKKIEEKKENSKKLIYKANGIEIYERN